MNIYACIKRSALLALLTAALLSALSACTNRQIYNAIQQNRLNECEKMVDAQREQCVAQYQKNYDDYEREREEILK